MDAHTAQYRHLAPAASPDQTVWTLPGGVHVGAYLNERTGMWEVLEIGTDMSTALAEPVADRVMAELEAVTFRDHRLD